MVIIWPLAMDLTPNGEEEERKGKEMYSCMYLCVYRRCELGLGCRQANPPL